MGTKWDDSCFPEVSVFFTISECLEASRGSESVFNMSSRKERSSGDIAFRVRKVDVALEVRGAVGTDLLADNVVRTGDKFERFVFSGSVVVECIAVISSSC